MSLAVVLRCIVRVKYEGYSITSGRQVLGELSDLTAEQGTDITCASYSGHLYL